MDNPVGLGSVSEPVTANQEEELRAGLQDRANPRKHRVQPDGKNKPAAGHFALIAAICSDGSGKGLDAAMGGNYKARPALKMSCPSQFPSGWRVGSLRATRRTHLDFQIGANPLGPSLG